MTASFARVEMLSKLYVVVEELDIVANHAAKKMNDSIFLPAQVGLGKKSGRLK